MGRLPGAYRVVNWRAERQPWVSQGGEAGGEVGAHQGVACLLVAGHGAALLPTGVATHAELIDGVALDQGGDLLQRVPDKHQQVAATTEPQLAQGL